MLEKGGLPKAEATGAGSGNYHEENRDLFVGTEEYRDGETHWSLRVPRLVIIFDELHELLASDRGDNDPFRATLNSSLATARGMGVAHVLCDQRLELLGEIATHGCSSHIVLNHPSTEQAASMLCLPSNSEYIELMPFFKAGEGLLHVVLRKTIPFDGNQKEVQMVFSDPVSQGMSDNKQDYRPYSTCDGICRQCDYKLHRVAYEAVAGQLSGASISYRKYIEAIREAKGNSDQVKRNNGIYQAKSMLITSCVNMAKKKAERLGVVFSNKALEHCVKTELQRQMAFLVRT